MNWMRGEEQRGDQTSLIAHKSCDHQRIENTAEAVDQNIADVKPMRTDSTEQIVDMIGERGQGTIALVTELESDILSPEIMSEDIKQRGRGGGMSELLMVPGVVRVSHILSILSLLYLLSKISSGFMRAITRGPWGR